MIQNTKTNVAIWTRFELELNSVKLHDNPVQDVTVQSVFLSTSGKTETADGFWDDDRTWRVRFCPNEVGKWRYETLCENDSGLGGQTGEFDCVPYEGDNPLYIHGDIHLSDDRYYLAHADGTPLFWLGDTGWNGALFSDKQSWDAYLADRRSKGFTGIQFMANQHRAAPSDIEGRTPFSGIKRITINPLFFQRLDQRIDAVNDAGMVSAPVLLWILGDSPGTYLPEDQRIVLARYMVARYGAHQIIWILGGDGNYQDERAEPWQRIGRAVFGDNPRRLTTMHPQGLHWIADEFRHEPWFGFNCYQSGHGHGERDLRWLCEGPPATDWNKEPRHPNLNFEPNYEGHLPYGASKPFDAHAVRRAAYWSLLVAPPAGVTYGAHGVWGWHLEERLPIDHLRTGIGPAWYDAIHFPGSTHMKYLRHLFSTFEWWRLRPAQELIAEQPGKSDPTKFIAAAKTEAGDLAVIYTPVGGSISVDFSQLALPVKIKWYNPAEGVFSDGETITTSEIRQLETPTQEDVVLVQVRQKLDAIY